MAAFQELHTYESILFDNSTGFVCCQWINALPDAMAGHDSAFSSGA